MIGQRPSRFTRKQENSSADGHPQQTHFKDFSNCPFLSADKAAGAQAIYIPHADGPWNDAQLARITALRAFSIENDALPCGKARYPVILFTPGGGVKALTYHTLFEDLASHRWVFAAIDPPYNARAVRCPIGACSATCN